MSYEVINVRLGVMRISRWLQGFDPSNYKQTTSQVWARIYDLPLEFRKEQNIMNITASIGLPLKIDQLMLSLSQRLYARVLVDVDLKTPTRKNISQTARRREWHWHEKLSIFCAYCFAFTYSTVECWRVGLCTGTVNQVRKWRPGCPQQTVSNETNKI